MTSNKKYLLKLYVVRKTPKSERAIKSLKSILKGMEDYDLKIVDVLKHPELAEEEKILAVPTLVRELPTPIQHIIGDLTEKEKVLIGLNLESKS